MLFVFWCKGVLFYPNLMLRSDSTCTSTSSSSLQRGVVDIFSAAVICTLCFLALARRQRPHLMLMSSRQLHRLRSEMNSQPQQTCRLQTRLTDCFSNPSEHNADTTKSEMWMTKQRSGSRLAAVHPNTQTDGNVHKYN